MRSRKLFDKDTEKSSSREPPKNKKNYFWTSFSKLYLRFKTSQLFSFTTQLKISGVTFYFI